LLINACEKAFSYAPTGHPPHPLFYLYIARVKSRAEDEKEFIHDGNETSRRNPWYKTRNFDTGNMKVAYHRRKKDREGLICGEEKT